MLVAPRGCSIMVATLARFPILGQPEEGHGPQYTIPRPATFDRATAGNRQRGVVALGTRHATGSRESDPHL